jgi:hypothetical protein
MPFLPYPPNGTTEAVNVLNQDVQILHNIVHGSELVDIPTENGNVPTIAKLIKEVEDATGVDVSLRSDLAAVNSTVLVASVPAKDLISKVDNISYSYSDNLRTLTINPNYNTTNPQCKSSINTAGTFDFPNRLGHSLVFGRDEAPLLTTYNVPVTFDVSSGQPYRNVFFLSKKNGFLQTFTPAELSVSGYGTSTISITPDAAKLSGSEEVTYWVVGDADQFNDNATQNNLQNNIGGYDNITNRQMSYNLGAHNLIDGTGDHNTIFGATYSVIYSSGSYNTILSGQNNQHGGISGYSFLGGEGNRNFGSYNFMSGAFSVNNAATKFTFSFGRTIDTKTCENSVAFGRDNVLNANSSFMWGQNHFNYSSHYSSVGGYGANCRNAGGQTFASSPDTVGANQKTEILSKRLTIASGGAWQKFNKLDDSPNLKLRASATALLTADVVVNLTGVNGLSQPINHAAVRCTALYNASLGIISSTFTILHSTGTGGNVEVKFTQTPLGTDYVALEIRDAVTNNSGSAIADISIVEFLRV